MKHLCLFCLLMAYSICAYSDMNHYIAGYVKHKWTNKVYEMNEVRMSLRDINNVVIDSIQENDDTDRFALPVPKEGGRFIITVEKDGMQPYCDTIFIKKFKSGEQRRYIEPIRMTPITKEIKLAEAGVRASKIKFFYKGDTLSYNADAFNTADGFMLEELIQQLPGVELKDNREIFVYGRRIESLLLNGERFFNDDKELMLENLPAYIVKNVDVYEKDRRYSLLSDFDPEKKEFVMDVKLKREYMIGWIANAEAGTGSSNRYLARLFALRFTPCSRLALISSINNLNDKRKPGENTEWTPEQMPSGLLATKMGGIDYMVKEKDERYRMEGNLTVTHTDGDNYTETTRENFQPDGNTFSYNNSKTMSHAWSVNTEHHYYHRLNDNNTEYNAFVSLDYNYQSNQISDCSALFDANLSNYNLGNVFDSISCPGSTLMRRLALNRSISESRATGHNFNVSLRNNLMNFYLFGQISSILANISYSSTSNKTYTQRYIELAGQNAEDQKIFAHDDPNRNLYYRLLGNWSTRLTSSSDLQLYCTFQQSFTWHNYEYDVLSRMIDWSSMLNTSDWTVLPSESEFRLMTMDAQNSYNQRLVQTSFDIQPQYVYYNFHNKWNILMSAQISYRHHRMNYYRGNHLTALYDGITRKRYLTLEPQLRISKDINHGNYAYKPEFEYSMSQSLPEMTSYIDVERNEDPLNIYTGNPDLKVTSNHNVSLTTSIRNQKNGFNLRIMPRYTIRQNAISYGYTYNKVTGVRRYRPENVNGNYILSLDISTGRYLDKKQKFFLNSTTYGYFNHGVDMIGQDNSDAVRSSVGSWWGTEKLRLDYKLGKHSIGLKGYYGIGHTTSSREDFNGLTLHDFNYGLTALFQLPLDFQLSTDLTMYSRRGYAGSEANTNDLVWNARISKRIPKANLTFMLDGFDILNNLSNITQTVNSQGRTETYRNALPRYFMLHVIYRLNKQPKKKQE